MKKQKKVLNYILIVFFLGYLLGQYIAPLFVVAKENTQVIDTEPVIWNDGNLPDIEERFAGYVTQKMYAGTPKEIAPFANFGEQCLTGINKTLYQKLKAAIEKVANGQQSSTIFEIPVSDLGIQTTWTAEELEITIQSTNEEIWNAIKSKLSEQGYDYNVLLDCLLADCPYDLYWYDKTKGTLISFGSYSYSTSSGKVTLTGVFRYSMTVAQEYRTSEYETDIAKTAATTTAVNNAKKIVNQYMTQSDYDKLTAYKEAICNLVSYNGEAANNASTPYGDPWQLIWVFDNNPATNVVCEGYSKAFQYLCDLTEFSSDAIACYTVTGYLSGGGHMWNIVTMNDKKHYLVDVTNCDDGTIGAPDQLFLAGLSGFWDTHYSFSNVTYSYDTDTKALFGENILTLASSNYQKDSVPDITVSISGEVSIMTYGDNNTLTANISEMAAECTYQWLVNGQPVDGATENTYDLSTLGAGEHNIQVKVKVDGYSFTSPSYLVTVKKYTPTITFNAYSLNYYYTGKPVSVPETLTTVTLANDEIYDGNISYSYRKEEGTEWISGLPTEVGTYHIKAQTEEQSNYNKAETETYCQITITYLPFVSTILYNNTKKQSYYNQPVSISAADYQVSDSPTGSFSDTYLIAVPKNDGTLQKRLYFKNENGEISDGQKVTLSFDVSAPTGSIQLGTKTWQDFSASNIFEKYIVGENNTVTITAQDAISGMAQNGIQYYIYEGNTPYTDADSLAKANILWTTYEKNKKPMLPENQNCVIYVKLTDQLGNTSYLCSSGIFIQEDAEITPPQISNVTAEDSAVETTGVNVSVGMTTAGTFYYVVLPAEANVPTSTDIIATVNRDDAGASGGTVITGTVTSGSGVISDAMIVNNENEQITLTGLQANTNYVIYFVSVIYITDVSNGGNSITSCVGDISFQSFKTKETVADTQKPGESTTGTITSGSAIETSSSASSAEKEENIQSLSNGAIFSAGVLRYRVTDAAKKQVEVIGLGKNSRNVTIPATVRSSSTEEQFRVVSIGNKAFKNNKKMKKVVIGSSVKRIGKQAFANCKKLKSITIQTKSLKMNTVGTKAFRGISAKAVIKTPKKKFPLYQKILRKKGVGTGVAVR